MRAKAAITVLFLAYAGAAWAGNAGDLRFTDLEGAPAGLGEARLVAFWRSDCAPCLKEMGILPEIARQNADLPVALISLQDAANTSAHLTPMPDNVHVLVAQSGGKEVLAAFGNDKTLALPFSVMLNRDGTVCGRHYGILGPEKVKEWREKC